MSQIGVKITDGRHVRIFFEFIWAQGARAGDPLFLSVEQQGRLEYGPVTTAKRGPSTQETFTRPHTPSAALMP